MGCRQERCTLRKLEQGRWLTRKQAARRATGEIGRPATWVKKFGGERVIGGNIIVRQRGTRFHAGDVGMGTDHTLFATAAGEVAFEMKGDGRQYVSVRVRTAAE